MRLLELHLDRFGCFTDRRLTFRADAGLTVVFGANEAGKSTALAAIADVLYGIEERSQFRFQHDYPDMRVGATIAAPDGSHLSFRRRKGKGVTLLDVSEAPIGEGALAPFLGGVDRALFLDAFGLNRERLRKGASDLMKGGGRIGESLLAAAPGLSSLIALRQSLAAEADQLFPPKGRKVSSHPFWLACERHNQARKRVRQESLQAETVHEAHAGRKEAAQTVSELKQELRKLRQEQSLLGRLKHALPRLSHIDKLEADRAALGKLPEVTSDFPARCRAAIEAGRTLALEGQRLDQEIIAAKAKLEALGVDDALLGQADAVDRLADQRAAVVKATEDLPKREGALEKVRAALDECARRLGLPDHVALLAHRPPDAAVARARSLLDERRQLRRQRDERRGFLDKVVIELEELASERAPLGHVADPAPLRQRLDGLAGLPERIAGRDDLARSLAARQADIDDRLQRLVLPLASVEELARLAVPDVASVEQAIERFDDLAKRRAESHSERQRLVSQSARIERRIGELVAGGDVPTADALSEARIVRETLWQGLRPRLLGESLPDDPEAEIATYEAAVTHADQLADRRQAEADRIAGFRKLRSEQRECEDELAANEQALGAVAAEEKQAEADWNALWSPSGLKPKPPREMRAWLRARSDILHPLENMRGERARLAEIDTSLAETTDRLGKLAHGLGIEGSSPTELLKATAATVSAIDTTFQTARLIDEKKAGCQRRRGEQEAALGELDGLDTKWRNQWAEAAGAIGLREEALDREAEAALDVWLKVPELETSLKELVHRVEGIQQDWNDFEKAAGDLCCAIAPDLGQTPALSASAALRERLAKARQAATARDGLRATLAGLEDKAHERRRQEQSNRSEFDGLCQAAGLGDRDELGALALRIEQNGELVRQLSTERKALLDAADGFGETELRAELAGRDPDSLSARLRELGDEQEVLETRLNEAIRVETRAEAGLDRIEALAGAAGAAQDEQNALADIAGIIETWTGIAAAERLLSAAIEAYRAQHQNPLLHRASKAFAIATGGGFSGIALDYDDADSHRIVALRPDGARLTVDALSEGTADQLFLALRIATIEDHARRARPLPFIADDLFVTFDDTRTKAGLALLAELGRTTQTIVFTHHQHVIEAARQLLGERVETIELA